MSSADDTTSEGDRNPVTDFAVQPDVAALYNQYGDAMHQSARKVLAPHSMQSDAGDAVGVVVRRLVESHDRGELEHKGHWESYLRWASRHEALKIIERRRKAVSLDEHLENLDDTDTIYDRTEGLDPVGDQIVQRSEERDVRAAVAKADLTDREAYVVFCYFVKCMTDEQTSVELGLSRSYVSRTRRTAQGKIALALRGGDSG